jgi:hypothetical protein
MAEMKPRIVRVIDFVAESIENEANANKDRADILRNAAKIYRESTNQKTIRVWEDQPEKKPVDFIRPDPASR